MSQFFAHGCEAFYGGVFLLSVVISSPVTLDSFWLLEQANFSSA